MGGGVYTRTCCKSMGRKVPMGMFRWTTGESSEPTPVCQGCYEAIIAPSHRRATEWWPSSLNQYCSISGRMYSTRIADDEVQMTVVSAKTGAPALYHGGKFWVPFGHQVMLVGNTQETMILEFSGQSSIASTGTCVMPFRTRLDRAGTYSVEVALYEFEEPRNFNYFNNYAICHKDEKHTLINWGTPLTQEAKETFTFEIVRFKPQPDLKRGEEVFEALKNLQEMIERVRRRQDIYRENEHHGLVLGVIPLSLQPNRLAELERDLHEYLKRLNGLVPAEH